MILNKSRMLIILIAILLFFQANCTNRVLKDNRKFGIEATELRYKIDNRIPIALIDVRTTDEYYSGHIAGAKLFPAEDVFSNVNQLPQNKEIILYCSDGQRSLLVAKHLAANGFTSVKRLNGGIKSWTWELVR